ARGLAGRRKLTAALARVRRRGVLASGCRSRRSRVGSTASGRRISGRRSRGQPTCAGVLRLGIGTRSDALCRLAGRERRSHAGRSNRETARSPGHRGANPPPARSLGVVGELRYATGPIASSAVVVLFGEHGAELVAEAEPGIPLEVLVLPVACVVLHVDVGDTDIVQALADGGGEIGERLVTLAPAAARGAEVGRHRRELAEGERADDLTAVIEEVDGLP